MTDALYAYVCNDRGQGEEVIAAIVPGMGLGPVPLVFGNERIARMMGFIAIRHAKGIGKTVHLVKFTKREVLETFDP